MGEKILLAVFHCDNCGLDTHLANVETEKDKEGYYHCTHCGNNHKKTFYSFDDYYVTRVKAFEIKE